jgi:hypothetical protein
LESYSEGILLAGRLISHDAESDRRPVPDRFEPTFPRQGPGHDIDARIPSEVEHAVKPKLPRLILRAADLVHRHVEREVLAQPGRLDLDKLLGVIAGVER